MPDTETHDVHRIAAFAVGETGGNPAGVLISQSQPCDAEMQAIAARVGYSETAFASQEGDHWRVRYFAPSCEVDFCGHATIALGAVLSEINGPGTFPLWTKAGEISVKGSHDAAGVLQVELSSPPTRSGPVDAGLQRDAMDLFGLADQDLDPAIAPAIANAGNDHLVFALSDRVTLAGMRYDLEAGRKLMAAHGLTTINLIHSQTPTLFQSRNAFAIGGVIEDPATGAAAAALAGYLRDQNWPTNGQIEIRQGYDMGSPSRLVVRIPDAPGSSVQVAGTTRHLG